MIAMSHHELAKARLVSQLKSPVYEAEELGSTEISAARALLSLTPHPKVPNANSRELYLSSFAPPVPDMVRSGPKLHFMTDKAFLKDAPDIVSCDSSASTAEETAATTDESTGDWSLSAPTEFFTGSTSLALPSDEDFLSPLHSFMRQYCVEAYTATDEDVSEPRHHGGPPGNGRVSMGQVGIRCIHCKHRPMNQRRERAVCFPSSLKNIYHSIETWQRRHSLACEDIPMWVKKSMTELIQKSKSGAGGRRHYWEDSSRRLGMADTSSGIRFIRPPGDFGEEPQDSSLASFEQPGEPVVRPEDKEMVTDYLFLLLDQMETCLFTEEDRAGGRSKVKDCPVGYPGMQCKHCMGKAGFGRYFPTTLGALTSANSDRNIFNHIVKCRRCPRDLQDQLKILRDEHQKCKNKRGSRKLFFEHVWERLHYN